MKDDRLHRKVRLNGVDYTVPYVPVLHRLDLIKKYHVVLGHMAANSLLPLLSARYYWPDMRRDLIQFGSTCELCQLQQSADDAPRRSLHPHEPIGLPFLKWGLDFLQDLPETSTGYKHAITAVDYATKYVIVKPVKRRDASSVAQFIYENITCRFGSPLEIITDRAMSFFDSVLQEYLKILEIHHLPTTPYTPRSNGTCERMHRSLNGILTKLCAGDRHRWDFYLPQAALALNARKSNATGFSPFYLCHGFEPRLPGDALPMIPPSAFDVNNELDVAALTARELARLGQNRAAALQRLRLQAAHMKSRYDQTLPNAVLEYKIGDMVKLRNHRQCKFQFPWTGPYSIVDVGPNGTFYLMKPSGERLDYLVNMDHIAPYTIQDPEYYYSGADAPLSSI